MGQVFKRAVMAKGILQYGKLAKYYDLLYQWKDYAREARVLERLISRYKRSQGNALLDVGCGTGQHIKHLMRKFDCVGVDVNKAMLEQARRKLKGVEFVRADMVDFDLRRKFDIILCLFSAIGYVRTYSRLGRTLKNFARHLRPGGVVIIEPWFARSVWKDGLIRVLTEGTGDLKITRVDYSKTKGDLSILDEGIIVAEKGRGIAVYRDRMVMGLFEKDEFLRLMEAAGLDGRYLKTSLAPGRGLFVGTRRELHDSQRG